MQITASVRHQVLQLAIIFTCSINQLSPGAYLLRRDLFPSIVQFIKSPTTERFTFEATLLLSLLANFHKSDAAKLNPYLQRIRDTSDKELMRQICWASNFACDVTVKAYQEISDDSTPTFAKTVGSLIASLRPDRALAKQPLDPPRELFKNQPIEACVALFPLFEFLFFNPIFTQVFMESPTSPTDKAGPPLHYTTLSLSSYLLTHASSSSSPRAMAYANLAMNMLLVLSENSRVMEAFCAPSYQVIRLCRQRMPLLPMPTSSRPLVCALLDCCILWLRHNLHKRLETSTYTTCIWTCHRVLWYLHKVRARLDYEWSELWVAIIGLLAFLASKLETLVTTGGVERLIRETIRFLDFSIRHAEMILPRPGDIHELIYELVRSSHVLRKQMFLLQSLGHARSTDRRVSLRSDSATKSLKHVLSVVSYYEGQLSATSVRSAEDALRVVAKLIEKDGLDIVCDSQDREDEPNKGEDVIGFIRCGYADSLALMP
ncbi:hypothetical protein F5I97DRAFT_2025897 [Phlebopus sp. FC_14]|nr:hypothetical protein F5I97DRAFT_2025897 [Phlebopus sp. FC_14]